MNHALENALRAVDELIDTPNTHRVDVLRTRIADALREATRVERERCCKDVCHGCLIDSPTHYNEFFGDWMHEDSTKCVANRIRHRSPTSDATK